MLDAVVRFSQFLVQLWFRATLRLRVSGLENFPRHGAVIVASNHISAYDPPLVGSLVPRVCHYMAKKELFEIPVFGNLIRFYRAIPIDRQGRSLGAVREVRRLLTQGCVVLIFPEGTRSRDGEIRPPKEGVGMLMAHTDAVIIPVYIDGLFGKKPSLLKRPTVHVRFGAPLPRHLDLQQQDDRRASYNAIAIAVIDAIRELSKRHKVAAG